MSQSFEKVSGGGNRRWLWIGGGCLALLACLCVAAVVIVGTLSGPTLAQVKQLVGLGGAESASIDYAPLTAPIYVSINPNFAQLANAKKVVDILQKNPALKQKVDQAAQQGGGGDSNLNFDRDIVPWIGSDAGIVVLDLPSSPSTSNNSNAVLVLASRDQTKAADALGRIRKDAEAKGTTFSEETYKDVKITTGTASDKQNGSSAYAIYQDQVLVGSNAGAIKQALDTKMSGDKASLKNSPAYLNAIAQLPKDRVGALYVDIATLIKQSSVAQGANAETLNALSAVAVALSFADDGIRLDYTSTFDPNKAPDSFKKLLANAKVNPGTALDHVPDSSIFTLAGADVKSSWNYYKESVSQNPSTNLDKALSDFKKQTGVDLDEDVFSWMTGEFAITVLPAKPLALAGPGAPAAGVLIELEAKDQTLVNSKLDKITKAFGAQGLRFTNKKVNGVDMQIASAQGAQGLSLGYGFVDNFLVIGSADDVLGAAVDGSKSPLSKNIEFQASTRLLPPAKAGMAFISVQKVVDVVKPILSKTQLAAFQKDVEPILKSFKGVSVATAPPKDNAQSGLLFVHVAE